MFGNKSDKLYQLISNYYKAVGAREEAENVKKDILANLLIDEDSGKNTQNARKALGVAKTNVELSIKRVEGKRAAARDHVKSTVEADLAALDDKFGELERLYHAQLKSAGGAIGQAAAFFSSLGPDYSDFVSVMQKVAADLKTMQHIDPAAFFEGYSKGTNEEIQNLHMLRNEYNKMKRMKIYATEKEQQIDKQLHHAIRDFKQQGG